MSKLKQIIANNFESFTYFYRQLRYRIFLAMGISIFVGALDALGLSMFLPLLQMVNDPTSVSGEGMGKMGVLVNWFQSLGIDLNIVTVLLIIVIFFTFKGVAKFCSTAYATIVQQYFIGNLRKRLLKAFNGIGYKYYVNSDVGRIQNTMTGEIERVSIAYRNYFGTMEQSILVLVYMGFAFFVDAKFALLVTVGGGLTNVLYTYLYKRTKAASGKFTKDSHNYQGQIIQHVANFKYLKASGLLMKYAAKLKRTIDTIEISRRKIGVINAILMGAREPLMILVVAVVILVQTKMLGGDLGPILLSLLFFYRALTSLMNMQNTWNRFLGMSGSLENTSSFEMELKSNREKTGKQNFARFTEGIHLKDVCFSYGKENTLADIDLHIPKNQTIAFVGESGSGKTTLVNVLAALLPIDSGSMKIDSLSGQEINPASYQKRIGYITQEPVIFNDTIFNNVTFWDEPTIENKKRFMSALQKAAIGTFVNDQPEKEETMLGNNGVNLSGGQKQRISIARELYKDIDILIMDEATSALDTETERAIQESIDKLKGEYTILIVAHRLSTIKNADRIVLMDSGHIVSEGNFQQLTEKNPNFKRMVELQEV